MKKLPFQAVAVDMDGTFLNEKSTFNKPRYAKIMPLLKQQQVHFIIASGNELLRCQNDLAEFSKDCDYVCENGALAVASTGQEVYSHPIPQQTVAASLNFLANNYPEVNLVLSGRRHAYYSQRATPLFKEMIHHSYATWQEVPDLYNCYQNDEIYKITLNASEEQVAQIIKNINQTTDIKISGVTGSGPWMDLINPEDNKGHGLTQLLNYLHISPQKLLAFGDGGNDLEMLELAGISYAMANGSDQVKEIAQNLAPSNTQDGVLLVLERYLSLS
ncbi:MULTISPECIES: Cof-type HAD-IIB family hydrolase [Lactobacillus]|uniref:HAD family hydrolase n=1 Tax=Lactobacillus xujianguonis TaxID=2495899 RepID=A0A437STQ2_9LACO|nr:MULTISPECIES: Cof-type HAD-IIB family hydrolase [Lactobacillus]RVU70237.1 HAD family hydrolase [Lactobacillus xujianguonis]RVU73270.1 HAD family hydrolase [Lactobacillus xujianguonis]